MNRVISLLLILCTPSFGQLPMGGVTANAAAGSTAHARQFNGTSDFLQSASALSGLSGLSVVSLSFWMYWNSFGTNDALAFESSSNYNTNSGAFIVDPNSGTHTTSIDFNLDGSAGTGSTFLLCHMPRPSAAAWHQYVLIWHATGTGNTCSAYVDGVSQSVTVDQAGTVSSFSSQTLNVMSRNGSSLFGAGRMSEIAFFNGTINSTDAASLASCARPTAVASATLVYYWPINQTSPEVATTGSINLNVTGTTNVASSCSF